ncbi:hypothetical protein B7463_g5369, partial [Scytalidium lignicola]
MAPHRRRDLAVSRRRVEDEGEEDGGPDLADLDDDSLTEGSILSDDDDNGDGSEISHIDVESPPSPALHKVNGNGYMETNLEKSNPKNGVPSTAKSDMDIMLNGLHLSDQHGAVEEIRYEDLREDESIKEPSPVVVKSTAQMDQPIEAPYDRRRREHEEYKKRRDEDPAFVPNRGAFFMHDHRHPGPAANGFRPFIRGRGRGRPGIGGPYAPINQIPQPFEPTDAPWTHDMHEIISEPAQRNGGGPGYTNGVTHGSNRTPATAPRSAPLDRALSTTKHIGNVQVRVFFGTMENPLVFSAVPVKQYTKLPDHRPPLRRDKPVRISLPDHPPRYIFPAIDRSFIFIPRAMRPNQQGFGGRGRGRSGLGSIGGYSRRTSVFGGSVYGSAYSPSVAMSRRSSVARDVNRDGLISPNGSTMSRPQMIIDSSRPVVKLPPPTQPVQQPQAAQPQAPRETTTEPPTASEPQATSVADQQRPRTYPLPQKPTFRENRPNPIPMHQPRPQKAVSVADIESPASLSYNPPQQHQQPFHQQVPIQVNGHGYGHDSMLHSRNTSYPSQPSAGTPLSQIPETAIHALPFQPNQYQQPSNFYPQPYPVPQGYYYPQPFNPSMAPPATSAPFVPGQPQHQSFAQSTQPQESQSQPVTSNLVAQEVNGMVYYYDASQLPAVAPFSAYPPQSYPIQQVGGVMGMGGMMTPSPDGFYYPQPAQGVVYYSH